MKKTQTAVIIALVCALLSLVCCQSESCSGNRDSERTGTAFITPDTWHDMAEHIEKERLPVHGVVIVRDDQPVFESYFNGWDGEKPHITHHIVNSVISCCVGICVDEGLIKNSDEKVAGFFPEYESEITDPRQRDITIRHLLTMSGGYRWESEHHNDPIKEFVEHPAIEEYMFSLPLESAPGSVMSQNSGGIFLLTRIIEKVSGKTMAEFVDEKLFSPLEIKRYRWEKDPICKTKGPYALYMRPRDMATYGGMILHNGTWNGKKIVSAAWLGEATRTCFPLSGGLFKVFRDLGQQGFGYCWWVFPDMVAAEGHSGQHIYVIRNKKAVVVFTARGRFALPAELYRDYIKDAL